ncbi:MAG: class I SAM-dependent methyltransferase [Nitrososphaerota archaeon]
MQLQPLLRSPLDPHRFRVYKAGLVSAFTRGAVRVLEVGCGHKHYAPYCHGDLYVGVDVELAPDIQGSATSLPIRSGCLDRVLMLDVLEHVHDIDKALGECVRVLRKDGLLLILTPNTMGFGLYDSFADPTHAHHLTWMGLERRLRRHGMNVLARIPLHMHIIWPLNNIRSRHLTAIQQSICVVAVKRYEA